VIGLIVITNASYIPIKRMRQRAHAKTKTIDATSYIMLNETGNILIKSNHDPATKLPAHIERIFLEAVSSLCLITRAISTTIDPATNQPFSIYNHSALEQVLLNHPLFAPLGQESADYKVRRSKDLVNQSAYDLFGENGSYAVQKKMTSIYSSLFIAAQVMSEAGDTKDARVGHLTLCCEHLMGIPIVTIVLMHISYEQCIKLSKQITKNWWDLTSETISFRKDTYLFNSPTLQNEFGVDINQVLDKVKLARERN